MNAKRMGVSASAQPLNECYDANRELFYLFLLVINRFFLYLDIKSPLELLRGFSLGKIVRTQGSSFGEYLLGGRWKHATRFASSLSFNRKTIPIS